MGVACTPERFLNKVDSDGHFTLKSQVASFFLFVWYSTMPVLYAANIAVDL